MDSPKVCGHYEHPTSKWHIAVRIADPWHPGDYFIYRMPEMFTINDERYLWQPAGAGCWPGVQPEAEPEWSLDNEQRATGYHVRFYDGIELSASAEAGDMEIRFGYVIKNGTDRVINVTTGSCFMTWNAPYFIDRRHERTFVVAQDATVALRALTPTPEELEKWSWISVGVGRPREAEVLENRWSVREAAAHGLVCVKGRDGEYALGLGWADAGAIHARSTIPCIHSEPSYPSVEPGQSVEATGKLYFSEDGVPAILERFDSDLSEGAIGVKLRFHT